MRRSSPGAVATIALWKLAPMPLNTKLPAFASERRLPQISIDSWYALRRPQLSIESPADRAPLQQTNHPPSRCCSYGQTGQTDGHPTDTWTLLGILCAKGKGSRYSIIERRVPELILVLGSQPASDVSHKPGGRLPLLPARPTVYLPGP